MSLPHSWNYITDVLPIQTGIVTQELDIEIENLLRLMCQIRHIPAMYMGRKSLERMAHFINGYSFGRGMEVCQAHSDIFVDFRNWLWKRLNISGTLPWWEVLISVTGDDKSAFDEFFKLFDEFFNEQSTELSRTMSQDWQRIKDTTRHPRKPQ